MEAISPPDQKKLEQQKLMDQIQYVFAHSTMYQEKYRHAGITEKEITCVQDLAKLPFTTKTELRESQSRKPPYEYFQELTLLTLDLQQDQDTLRLPT